jgi:hypothetical protein
MNCLDDMDICQIVDFVRGPWEVPREEVLSHVLSCDKCMLEVMELDEILSMPDVDEDEDEDDFDEEAYYAGLVKYLKSMKGR